MCLCDSWRNYSVCPFMYFGLCVGTAGTAGVGADCASWEKSKACCREKCLCMWNESSEENVELNESACSDHVALNDKRF